MMLSCIFGLLWLASQTTAQICSCNLDILPELEEGCRIYGVVGGSLIPWHRANATCLRAYNISYRQLEYEAMVQMCPYRNGTGGEATGYQNLLRMDTPLANQLKSRYDMFFEPSADSNTSYVLKPSIITRTGGNMTCVPSDRLCWPEVLVFFGDDPYGKILMEGGCRTVHQVFIADIRREQVAIRRIACEEEGVDICEPLTSQVREVASNNTCSSLNSFAQGDNVPEDCTPSNSSVAEEPTSASSLQRGLGLAPFLLLLPFW